MTDQQTDLRYHDSLAGDEYDADHYAEAGYFDHYDGVDAGGYQATWDSPGDWQSTEDGDPLDDGDSVDDWDAYVAAPRPAPPPRIVRPWYRDPRWLLALIALAAAALVVATVLLVTGRGSGEIPTAPELTTRTPGSTTSTPSPRSVPPRESATSSSTTTPTSASPTSDEPVAVDVPAPVEPTAALTEAPPEPPAPSASKSPAGPRINVTRTPMSFSPGSR